jgi:hypothetical protein
VNSNHFIATHANVEVDAGWGRVTGNANKVALLGGGASDEVDIACDPFVVTPFFGIDGHVVERLVARGSDPRRFGFS